MKETRTRLANSNFRSAVSSIKQKLGFDSAFHIIGWLWFIGCFIYLCVFMKENVLKYLDSDASAVLIYSEFLARTGGILSDQWYYSTGISAVDLHLVFIPLFIFFHTWFRIRLVGTVISILLLLASFFVLCKSLHVQSIYPWLASVLILPVSAVYAENIILLIYYIPTLCFAMLLIGLTIRFLSTDQRKTSQLVILSILSILVALLAGLGGMRLTLVTVIPLILATLITSIVYKPKAHKKLLTGMICIAISNIIGCVISQTIILQSFDVMSYLTTAWATISLEDAWHALADFIIAWGYISGDPLFSKHVITNLVAISVFIATIIALAHIINRKNDYAIEHRFLAVFVAAAMIVYVGLYTVTNMDDAPRYCLPISVFFAPIIVIWLRHFNYKKVARWAITTCLVIGLILSCSVNYSLYRDYDSTIGLRDVIPHILDMGYSQGYATYWHSNVLTELSNGQIEMWTMTTPVEQDGVMVYTPSVNPNNLYPWLQYKSHMTTKPSNAFILLSKPEMNSTGVGKQLEAATPLYDNGLFVVYDANEYFSTYQNEASSTWD